MTATGIIDTAKRRLAGRLARDMYGRYADCEVHTAKPGHPALLVGAHARAKRTRI